jgi:trehalose/maltose hydrolase-like predicted phosphorylase
MNLWHIDEDTFNNTALLAQETVFTVGNGYFCTRGAFEEGYPRATPATLLFGVFDAIAVGKEELANAPDWLPLQLFINGERFRLDLGNVLAYQRTLDLQHGILSRTVRWESPSGIRLQIAVERFTSLADEHVGCIRYSVILFHGEDDMLLCHPIRPIFLRYHIFSLMKQYNHRRAINGDPKRWER